MRIFVGVEIDERVRTAAAETADWLRARLDRSRLRVVARWVEPANLHVTVWFIGEAQDERAAGIRRVLEPRFETEAFDLRVNGCGAFPASGPPRVFWLGVAAGTDSMTAIHREVADRLASVGCVAEKRPYSPHLTLARVKEIGRSAVGPVREALASAPSDCGACRVAAVTLFRSHLAPKGARYEPLLRVPLS
jgi:2'-5' RNA ligase